MTEQQHGQGRPVSVYLYPEDEARVSDLREATGLSASEVVRLGLELLLDLDHMTDGGLHARG